MANRLDKAFGGGADTWYRLQSAWDLAQARKKARHHRVEKLAPGQACDVRRPNIIS